MSFLFEMRDLVVFVLLFVAGVSFAVIAAMMLRLAGVVPLAARESEAQRASLKGIEARLGDIAKSLISIEALLESRTRASDAEIFRAPPKRKASATSTGEP